MSENSLIGIGIYSVPEAARLSAVSTGRIRRWLKGYSYRSAAGEIKKLSPVWRGQHQPGDSEASLGFLDLIEVRFVNAFLSLGMKWKTIRRAEQRARDEFHTDHPFATKLFRSDGRTVFLNVLDGREKSLLDVLNNQLAFEKVISPYLIGLDFEHNSAARWWPLAPRKTIVIDPKRSFGQPIVNNAGVPTAVLAKAVQVEGSIETVAKWYRVNLRSVRAAVEYEKCLAA
jgi:uncharacterized protein (DUF433 family)